MSSHTLTIPVGPDLSFKSVMKILIPPPCLYLSIFIRHKLLQDFRMQKKIKNKVAGTSFCSSYCPGMLPWSSLSSVIWLKVWMVKCTDHFVYFLHYLGLDKKIISRQISSWDGCVPAGWVAKQYLLEREWELLRLWVWVNGSMMIPPSLLLGHLSPFSLQICHCPSSLDWVKR